LSKYDGALPKVTETTWSAEVQSHIKELQTSIDQMHKKLFGVAAKKLMEKRSCQNVSARFPNFEIGDFVLFGRTLARKTSSPWNGKAFVVW
jgi:hypothetical protein